MKVLLINPPDELESMFGSGKVFVQRYEPLGLLYIAAVAEAAGHAVEVIDAHAEELDMADIKRRIAAADPEVVGISTLTCSGAIVSDLGRWLKQTRPATMVVLGNIHAAVFAKTYLSQGCCDAVVHGEGEYPFRQLLEVAAGTRRLAEVDSVSYLHDGSFRGAQSEAFVHDLTKLPRPARHLVDQRLYKLSEISNQSYVSEGGKTAKTMTTSRGCPFRCRFCVVHRCATPRYDSPERVVDELELLEKEHNAGYVYIMDPLFMGNRQRTLDICSEIRRRGLSIRWGCDANVNYINSELVEAMAAANCYELSLGIESGVQRMLDAVNKKVTPQRVSEAVATIRRHSKIKIEGLFILGLPGETRAEAEQTIRFAIRLGLDMAQFSILCPYPGSPLFEELVERGEIDSGLRPDGGVDTSVWHRYSSYICFTDMEPIWTPETLSTKVLRDLQKKALRKFYLRPSQVWRQARRVRLNNVGQMIRVALDGFF
jgi:anaerobic magnesium-protoporphyrin IX monomethyl ester cyclase